MAWTLSNTHTDARDVAARRAANVQSIATADAGSGNSKLRLYTAEDGALLATITLAKPCGTIDTPTGRIKLAQQSASGDLVAATGQPTFAQWLNGSGTVIGTCSVSAEAGDGDLKISGREDGMVFAGGYIALLAGLIG